MPRTTYDSDTTLVPLLTHDEVAAVIGMHVSSVKAIEKRALAKLRDGIRAAGFEFGDLKGKDPRVSIREEGR